MLKWYINNEGGGKMKLRSIVYLCLLFVCMFSMPAVARHYDAMEGRFISKDPIGVAGGVNQYVYVQNSPIVWIDPFGLVLVSPEEGQRIVDEAKTWVGTPYFPGGGRQSSREKADCSGATWRIYESAGFPYEYSDSASFPGNSRFKVSPGNQPQPGDIGRWNGHLLIFDSNAGVIDGQKANAWSARNRKYPFGPVPTAWWEKSLGPVMWYRYDKP